MSDFVGLSGEEALEKTQEEMYEELEVLLEKFREDVKSIAKREHYDLIDDAKEYAKDNLW